MRGRNILIPKAMSFGKLSPEQIGGQQTQDRNRGFPMLDENIINLR